ncbi:MAG TPA: aminotransferase, partial [Firmicutes bacterium]|nr:aminotransferase [Bacillota bacterium]
NSSLALMHDLIARALLFGVDGHERPWGERPVTFLCPSPGYDRHFALCEFFNIHMIPVKLDQNGPDMEQVEKLVAENESIKGIWCVPR